MLKCDLQVDKHIQKRVVVIFVRVMENVVINKSFQRVDLYKFYSISTC